MTLRNLIINSAGLECLRLDGPALKTRSNGKSPQWFPLRRISQLFFIEQPAVGMDAAFAVAQQGLPVSFFSRRGELIAQLINPRALPHPMRHWLEASAHDPLLKQAYEDWLENQLRHTYGMMGCVACTSERAARAANMQLVTLVRKSGDARLLDGAQGWFTALLFNRLQHHLAQLGLPVQSHRSVEISNALLEAGVTLCMSWLAALITLRKDNKKLLLRQVPHIFEERLGKDIDAWIQRGFYMLQQQLEATALGYDSGKDGC